MAIHIKSLKSNMLRQHTLKFMNYLQKGVVDGIGGRQYIRSLIRTVIIIITSWSMLCNWFSEIMISNFRPHDKNMHRNECGQSIQIPFSLSMPIILWGQITFRNIIIYIIAY